MGRRACEMPSGSAAIRVVESAEHGRGDERAVAGLDGAGNGSVSLEAVVRSLVVVGKELSKHAKQVPLPEGDDVVGIAVSNRGGSEGVV